MGISIDKAILRVEHSSMSVDDKETADFIIDIMRKYQKIQEIVNSKTTRLSYELGFRQIKEVIKNENN